MQAWPVLASDNCPDACPSSLAGRHGKCLQHKHRWPSLASVDCLQVLNGAFSSISISMSYIADVIQPHNRAPVFGMTMACFYFGFLLGPQLGGHLDPLQCGIFSAAGLAACILWVILLLPETLPPAAKLAVRPSLPGWYGCCITLPPRGLSWDRCATMLFSTCMRHGSHGTVQDGMLTSLCHLIAGSAASTGAAPSHKAGGSKLAWPSNSWAQPCVHQAHRLHHGVRHGRRGHLRAGLPVPAAEAGLHCAGSG